VPTTSTRSPAAPTRPAWPDPPQVIQGGMGVGVSSWQLAKAVARAGQLGVVSGTATAVTVARRLALGDEGGHLRRVLARFPLPELAERVLARHLGTALDPAGPRFRGVAQPSLRPPAALTELTVVATYAEVALAKEGHDGPVGINLLEKIQLPTLASLYGAMLAGVDVVLMGAGVPARIPSLLDRLADGLAVSMPVTVAGAPRGEVHEIHLDPWALGEGGAPPAVHRPRFVAIVSSATMATFLARNAAGGPDGFVVELPVAGGHNAPPRGAMRLDADGQPIYGPRDAVDLDAIAALGVPFWLAGGYASAEALATARAAGAAGVQVGTAFAFCEESGMAPEVRDRALAAIRGGQAVVRTDPLASPTGYPFKLLEQAGTVSEADTYTARRRVCDLGYLRDPYRREDGAVGYRCASEPVEDYVRKGGDEAATVGRRCLCNGLLATVGLGQVDADGVAEPALVTAGDAVAEVAALLPVGARTYTARDVLARLLQR
jgi:nitronate monooxygenase